jgi:hypothetical protein
LAAITPVVATTRRLYDVFRHGENLGDIENTAAGEIIVSIIRKLIAWPLFDARARQQAGIVFGQKLFDLAYTYRKNGSPLACCWATMRSLANHGPLKANLKNLVLCWPDLLLHAYASFNPVDGRPTATKVAS